MDRVHIKSCRSIIFQHVDHVDHGDMVGLREIEHRFLERMQVVSGF